MDLCAVGNSSGQCAVCTLGAGSGQPIEAETGYFDGDKRAVAGAHGVVCCRKQQPAVCWVHIGPGSPADAVNPVRCRKQRSKGAGK